MNSKRIFASESVTEGHPDKVCDMVSDGHFGRPDLELPWEKTDRIDDLLAKV